MLDDKTDRNLDFHEVLREEIELLTSRREWIYEKKQEQKNRKTQAEEQSTSSLTADTATSEEPSTSSETSGPPETDSPTGLQKKARLDALKEHYIGLALSGGGIRSATFSLGVLQGLASLKLLSRFDYLSTVSGGGYIGGWYAAWIKREESVLNVENQLSPSRIDQAKAEGRRYIGDLIVDEEPEPVHHLRTYSNFLTPRPGLLSVDTWAILSIYVRNSLINALFLVPLVVLLVLSVRILVWFFDIPNQSTANLFQGMGYIDGGIFIAFVVLLVFVFMAMAYQVYVIKRAKQDVEGTSSRGLKVSGYHKFIIVPLMLAMVLSSWSFGIKPIHPPSYHVGEVDRLNNQLRLPDFVGFLTPDSNHSLLLRLMAKVGVDSSDTTTQSTLNTMKGWKEGNFPWFTALIYGLLFGVISLSAHVLSYLFFRLNGLRRYQAWEGRGAGANEESGVEPRPRQWDRWRIGFKLILAVFLAGFSGGFLFLTMLSQVLWQFRDRPWAALVVGPPLTVLVIVVATYIQVWLINRSQGAEVREWWARFAALLTIYSAAWFAFFGLVLYGPLLIHRFEHLWIGSGLTVGWLMTTISGAVLGRRNSGTDDKQGGSFVQKALMAIAPLVFVIGLLVLVSFAVSQLIDDPFNTIDQASRSQAKLTPSEVWVYWAGITTVPFLSILFLGVISSVAVLLAFAMSDVNLFSLHEMYANRLTRAYLGASRPKVGWESRWTAKNHDDSEEGGAPTATYGKFRRGNVITGFDPDDDLPLWTLNIDGTKTQVYDKAKKTNPFRGPYLIVNTALNLVAGKELAWQDRKAESFSLTPNFCGSKGTGYVRTTQQTGNVLTLGRAMAISGAAVDSNIGIRQSSALIALMTILNARLGWWLKNPRFPRGWDAGGPSVAKPLLWEMLGLTDANKEFVHLSDGGHFENLAVYELVRRRCRYIVCCDAGTDEGSSDDNLANLVRLCRTDFGVRIELDTAPFEGEGKKKLGRWHAIVGKIRYDDVDGGELPGVFVMLRAVLTGDEPSDVQEYAAKHPAFPRESTLDQSFDEPQFESYRALGYHVAVSTFSDPMADIEETGSLWEGFDLQDVFVRNNQRLFSSIQKRWSSAPTNLDESFDLASKGWTAVQETLRSGTHLGSLSMDIYPELATGLPDASAQPETPEQARAQLHAVAQMIQVMENAWAVLNLRGYRDLPLYRGWMSVFRRWASTDAFLRHWPTLRVEYSQGFVRFCEDQLRLKAIAEVKIHDPNHPFTIRSIERLGREFSREWPRQKPLNEIISAALDAAKFSPPPLWLITQASVGGNGSGQHACGIVTIWHDVKADEHEMFVWIERAYRSMGIGSRCAKTFLDEVYERYLNPPGPGTVTVRVRFPAEGWRTPDDLEFSLWRNFFSHYDFGPAPGVKLNRHTGADVLLKKVYNSARRQNIILRQRNPS